MQVETYEQNEVSESGIESNEEQIALINKLGLVGQQSLISGDTEVCPYPLITDEERYIYSTILPKKSSINEYKDGPIPVRVLQVIAHAKTLDTFTHLYIYSEPSVDVDDPILVGTNESYFEFKSKSYRCWMLARWGKELAPLPELRQLADKINTKKLINQFSEEIDNLKATIERIKNGTANLQELV